MALARTNRILVVEEEPGVRGELQDRLSKAEYDVVTASNDSEALELLTSGVEPHGGVSLILLDDVLPDSNGIELLREIRRTTTRIELPIIVVTTSGSSGAIVEALKAEANDYVTKPIDFEVLLMRIETHLDLRSSHQSLHESHRSLVHAARMESVTQLAAGVAHEIRNPLAQIQMCLDGIRPAVPEDNKFAQEMCGMLGEAVVCAETIVSALIGQSEAAKLTLVGEDLNEFVTDTLEIMSDEIRTCQVKVVSEFADPPPTAFIGIDECRQVLMNVLLNGIEAMPDGGDISIRTGIRMPEDLDEKEGSRRGARVRNGEPAAFIEVDDGGHGIAETELGNVFDPFFTSKATAKKNGKGLGLTVCRKLIDLHGGEIQLRNLPNGGVRATIYLRHLESGML